MLSSNQAEVAFQAAMQAVVECAVRGGKKESCVAAAEAVAAAALAIANDLGCGGSIIERAARQLKGNQA